MMQTKVHIDEAPPAASAAKEDPPPPFRPSPEAVATFELMEEEDGLKHNTRARETDMSVLGDPRFVFPKTIGVHVDVGLEREKDRTLPDRARLAEDVRSTASDELEVMFRGGEPLPVPEKGHGHDVVLCVRVLLVSDGSSSGHRWMAENAVGEAKLTLAYCLQNARTGRVAVANQLYATEDCRPGSRDANFREYAAAVVRTMARNLAGDIAEEVTHEIIGWKQGRKGE